MIRRTTLGICLALTVAACGGSQEPERDEIPVPVTASMDDVQAQIQEQLDAIEKKVQDAEAQAHADHEESMRQAEEERVADAARREAEHEARQEQRRREREEAEDEREEAERAKKQAREDERRAREQERLAAQKAEHEERQRTLQALAEAEFSKLELDPQIELSASLRALGARAEFKGKGREGLLSMHRKKDWLGLVNAMLEIEADHFRSDSEVRHAAERLRKHEFKIVLSLEHSASLSQERALVLIKLKHEASNPVRADWHRWEQHPDGDAHLHPWSANDGRPVIAIGDPYGDFRLQRVSINQSFQDAFDALKTRRDLGDVEDREFEANREGLIADALARGRDWALAL